IRDLLSTGAQKKDDHETVRRVRRNASRERLQGPAQAAAMRANDDSGVSKRERRRKVQESAGDVGWGSGKRDKTIRRLPLKRVPLRSRRGPIAGLGERQSVDRIDCREALSRNDALNQPVWRRLASNDRRLISLLVRQRRVFPLLRAKRRV